MKKKKKIFKKNKNNLNKKFKKIVKCEVIFKRKKIKRNIFNNNYNKKLKNLNNYKKTHKI